MAKNELAGISPINVDRLVVWAYDEKTDTYGDAIDISGRIMSYKDSMTKNSTDLRGAGRIIETAYGATKGTLEIALAVDLINELRKQILGETYKNGVNLTTVDDVIPSVVVAVQSSANGGKVNLRKWLNATLVQGEDAAQQREDNVTYSTSTLTGTYIPDENGIFRARYDHIDPTEKKAEIDKWFTDATYVGEEEAG